MLRKLPGFLTACILIIMPVVANAMGFGSIKLNSALNEPLDADISLLSATANDVSGLTVKLASLAAFAHAGIDRPAFLMSFKMKIKSRADNTFYIHLTSVRPVREPFLDFLLELSWYNGRILREYTVLLNPPGRIIKQPAVIASPEVTQPAQIARTPKPVPVEPETLPAKSEPAAKPAAVVSEELAAKKETVTAPKQATEKTVSKPESIQPAAKVQSKQENKIKPLAVAATAAGVVAAGESSAFSDNGELFPRIPLTSYHDNQTAPASKSIGQGKLDYGITRKGDNLWTVAKKLRVGNESASIYQIMMALLKHNPGAFRQGNINRLKIGHVLRIQDPAMLQAMSDSEARAAYRVQTEEWDHYHQNLAAAAATAPQAIVADNLGSQAGKSEADNSGEVTVAAPGGKELTAGEGLSDTAVSGDVATLKDELNQLRSDADAMGGTDAALNKKIKDMEAELADMQRAISIKDTDLAAVQQMAQKTNENKNEEKTVTTKTASEMPATTEEKTATNETGVAAGAETKPESTAENQQAAQAAQEMPAAETKTAVAATSPAETQKPAVQSPAPVVAPAPMPTPEHKAGLMSTVTGVLATIAATVTGMIGPLARHSLLLFIGLPVLLVLVILMVIVMRRRKQAQGGFQESILSGEANPINGDQAEAKEEESSFLSDFAVSGAGAIQAEDSEVDPLTEADVFMAYGRYEAAEERLTEAMEEDPSRKELKLKLLELYNATKNQSAFESAAEDFYASLGENANTDPLWEKVLSMGKELAPNNPLFTGDVLAPAASDTSPAEGGSVGLSDSQVMDIGLETGVFQTEELEPVQDDASGLDFSLDLDGLPEPEKTETIETDVALNEPADSEDSGLDFNLDLDSNTTTGGADTGTSEPSTTEMEMSAETDSGLDFDSNTHLDKDEGESALVMDSDGLDFAIDAEDETRVDLQAEEDSTGLDFNLELDDTDATVQDKNQGSPDLEFSLDTNEVSANTVAETVGDELDHSMAINLDETAGDGDEDTAIDLNMNDAASPEEDDEIELHEDTMAINLGESLDIDNDSEDTAGDLSLDTEESSDAAILDLAAGGDEVGTKLDLARAYIDMGDPEGARSILDEVVDEGNDEQKQEAQQLIQQIG